MIAHNSNFEINSACTKNNKHSCAQNMIQQYPSFFHSEDISESLSLYPVGRKS